MTLAYSLTNVHNVVRVILKPIDEVCLPGAFRIIFQSPSGDSESMAVFPHDFKTRPTIDMTAMGYEVNEDEYLPSVDCLGRVIK